MANDIHILRDNQGEPMLTIVDEGRAMSAPLRIVFDRIVEFFAVDARSSLEREAHRKRMQKSKASLSDRKVLKSPPEPDTKDEQYALPDATLEEG